MVYGGLARDLARSHSFGRDREDRERRSFREGRYCSNISIPGKETDTSL